VPAVQALFAAWVLYVRLRSANSLGLWKQNLDSKTTELERRYRIPEGSTLCAYCYFFLCAAIVFFEARACSNGISFPLASR
jgi:hypothetical protein